MVMAISIHLTDMPLDEDCMIRSSDIIPFLYLIPVYGHDIHNNKNGHYQYALTKSTF